MQSQRRSDDFLAHHGILGQKWGVRRFQNDDGTLTPEGALRYGRKVADKVVDTAANALEKAGHVKRRSELNAKYNKAYAQARAPAYDYTKTIVKDATKRVTEKLEKSKEFKDFRAVRDEVLDDLASAYNIPIDQAKSIVSKFFDAKNFVKNASSYL